MLLRYEGVFAQMESVNGADYGAECLETSHLDDIKSYTLNREELLVLIRAACNFVKNPNMPVSSTHLNSTTV